MRTPQLIGVIALASIWGASFLFIKVMLDELGPVAIAWLRLGGGAALILPVVAVRRTAWPRRACHWRDVLAVAVLGSAVPLVLIPWGEREVDSGLAGVLNGSMPLFVALFAHRLLPAERIDATRASGVALGFIGVVVVIGPDLLDVAASGTQGQLAIVAAAVCYAAAAVWVRRRLVAADSTLLAGSQNVLAFAMLTPLLLVNGGVPDLAGLPARVLLATAALGLLSSGVATSSTTGCWRRWRPRAWRW